MSTLQKDIFLGSDPEFFLYSGNEIFPAFKIIGNDMNPLYSKDGKNKIYNDNILLEYTTTPSNSVKSWLHNQTSVLKEAINYVNNYGFNIVSGIDYEVPDEYMDDPRSHTFGCNPVLNAYSEDYLENELPAPHRRRFAGGHIHIAYPNENLEQSRLILKLLDIYLGLPSLLIEPFNIRRAYYGKAGSYRREEGFKIEYRTLSNFWLYHDNYITWVYNTVIDVVSKVLKSEEIKITEEDFQDARLAIDSGNIINALNLCNKHNIKILNHEKNIRLRDPNEGIWKSPITYGSKIPRKSNNKRSTRLKGWRDPVFEESRGSE